MYVTKVPNSPYIRLYEDDGTFIRNYPLGGKDLEYPLSFVRNDIKRVEMQLSQLSVKLGRLKAAERAMEASDIKFP